MTCPLPVLTTLYAHCMLTTLASALCSLEKSQVPFHPRFPRWPSGKEPACHCRRCRRHGFNPWFRKIPQRRAWQPTPVFLPGESRGQKSLVGHSPWVGKESDMTEQLTQPQQPTITITKILPIDFLSIFTYILEKKKSAS